jgi:hypothetical protein
MKKNKLICFRATTEMHESLRKVAKEDRRSLSLTIEHALTSFLKERKAFDLIEKERRQFTRKVISLPAFVNYSNSSGKPQLCSASVIDISLGGVKISIPKNMRLEITVDPEGSKFQIIFPLPDKEMPISIDCEARSVVDSSNSLFVGASFTDADFNSYKNLQSYLM